MNQKDSDVRKLVEASAWLVRLAETDAGEGEHVEEFQGWLAEDARNADAWRQVQGPWRLFGDHATAPEIIAARRVALARAQQAGRRRWRGTAVIESGVLRAIAISVLVVLSLIFLDRHYNRVDVYSTGTSERHIVTLADGSTISLDAHSEVRVRYSAFARELQLVHGQAKFDVVHDAERPFSVIARGRRVIATGTSFNVDILDAKLSVTLIEGRVVVLAKPERLTEGGQDFQRIELVAGKQLVMADQAPPTITDVNVGLATAWQSGLVVFEDETLAEAAARLNRYSEKSLVIGDQATRNLKVSGVFKVGDMNGFVATITTYFPVSVHTQSDGDLELTQRQN